jgi:uncharacterized protein (DUF1800 family)
MSKIKHLYWRAGFGLSPQEWEERKNWRITKAVDQLFKEAKAAGPLQALNVSSVTSKPTKEQRKMERKRVGRQNTAWLVRMANPNESALMERMSLFWHGHFACSSKLSKLAFNQINAIRDHALGNFRDLVLAVAKDPSMIRYLNNQQNKKNKPNENFARELMELFTIGRGNYTEQDIKEAARAFTGWSSNLGGKFVFRRRQHDFGSKTFMGKTGKFDGDEIIDIILEQRATAQFICTKIYRYFVNEKVDTRIVNRLADQFYKSDYNIEALMRSIFTSDWFYDKKNIGIKIKSPVDLVAGMSRGLNVQYDNEQALIFAQKALGQVLFNPPNVAGWAGGKAWIDNSTMMLRLNLVTYLLYASDVDFRTKSDLKASSRNKAMRKLEASVNLAPLQQILSTNDKERTIEELSDFLLQRDPAVDKKLIQQYAQSGTDQNFIKMAIARITSLPEYQLC